MYPIETDGDDQHIIFHATEKVKSVTPKQVTRIKFWHWLDKEETPSEDLWKEMDGKLSTDLFKSLLEVHSVCECRNGESGAEIPGLSRNVHKKGTAFIRKPCPVLVLRSRFRNY